MTDFYLSDFSILRPPFECAQDACLDWILEAHTQAEATEKRISKESDEIRSFRSRIENDLTRVSCKPEDLEKRGFVLSDFQHLDWEKMALFPLHEQASGKRLKERALFFEKAVDQVFESFYREKSPPDEIIHVTCTGYASPSGAQKMVSKKNSKTLVTHAYHMGCYASIPALRMASGTLKKATSECDIVHTEICSLHFQPDRHLREELVIQSLFADGFIKYKTLKKKEGASFHVLNLLEEIIPQSSEEMSWRMGECGFQMVLTKEVPRKIREVIFDFLKKLIPSEMNYSKILKEAIFAIHPGGPRILREITRILEIEEHQMEASRKILKFFGNMSSATLPHIWEEIALDERVKKGTAIISLAFGPGLTIAGSYMEKI